MYDVLIVGGGVVGSAIARELCRYRLKIGVLEKNTPPQNCVFSILRCTGKRCAASKLVFFHSEVYNSL